MAQVDIPGGFWVPDPLMFPIDVPGYTNIGAIGNTSEIVGFIFRVPKSGILDTVGFYIGAIATPQDLEVSFRAVNMSTGYPAASADQTYVIPLASLVVSGWNITGTIANGGTPRTVTKGDLMAVAFRCNSATGSMTFRVATNEVPVNFPYSTYIGAIKGGRPFPIAIRYDDGSYAYLGPVTYPYAAFGTLSVANNGTPDEIGVTLEFPVTVSVDGAWIKSHGAGPFDVCLYDSDGTTLLASASHDPDVRTGNSPYAIYVTFATAVELDATTKYYLSIKPTSTTAVSAYDFTAGAADELDGTQLGTGCFKISRTDAGAWTEETNKRVMMGVHVTAVASGGGGEVSHTFAG